MRDHELDDEIDSLMDEHERAWPMSRCAVTATSGERVYDLRSPTDWMSIQEPADD